MEQQKKRVLCPVCESEREIHTHVKSGGAVLGSLAWMLMGIALGWLIGELWGAVFGAIILGGLSFVGFEVYYTLKLKGDLTCPVCQFDPVLYRRSPEAAKKRCLERLKMQETVFQNRWQQLKQARVK